MPGNVRSVVALVIGLTAWSLAPLWVVNARGLAPAPVVALIAIMIASVIALALSTTSRRYNLVTAFRSTHDRGLLRPAMGVGALAFFAYPLLYFSALQAGPALLVNLVNYLWPIIGLVLVAVMKRETSSLELLMAAAFGFVGAALAILTGTQGGHLRDAPTSSLPFALAALGAIAYGTMSAFMNAVAPRQDGLPGVHFFLIALCTGGLGCAIVFGAIAVVDPHLVTLDLSHGRGSALMVYAVLHPLSHFCWLTAIQDPRIPGFTSAFIVPVFSTVTLAVAAHGVLGPEVLAALVLVLCGVLFSAVRDRGVPVAFAVTLAGTGSLQVSVSVPEIWTPSIAGELSTLTDTLVALVAIFGGFVLTNSITRYGSLQAACAGFYQRARDLLDRGEASADEIGGALDTVDGRMLHSAKLGRDRDAMIGPAPQSHLKLAREWARFDLVLANRVSPYEWLVLTIGATGVLIALHLTVVGHPSVIASFVRALATAVVVGLLFAVRDFDMNRPNLVTETLLTLRHRFGFAIPPGSALSAFMTKDDRQGIDWIAVALVLLVFASVVSVVMNVV